MRIEKVILRAILLFAVFSIFTASGLCAEDGGLKVVFATDPHLHANLDNAAAFEKTVALINKLNPDVVIIGGDIVAAETAGVGKDIGGAWDAYRKLKGQIKSPVYEVIGNHDIDEKSGKGMYYANARKAPYSFDIKGRHFILLDSIYIVKDEYYRNVKNRRYAWYIDEPQLKWLKEDVRGVNTPIILVTHVPFVTAHNFFLPKKDIGDITVSNAKTVLDILERRDLKVVLQGHLHFFEDIFVRGIDFITGGTLYSYWRNGTALDTEDGLVLLEMKKDDIEVSYIPTNWDFKQKIRRIAHHIIK